MTISSSTRKFNFSCNGAQTVFPFTCKIFSSADISVYLTDVSGNITLLTLGTNYSVALNSDQNNNPGGNVTSVLAYASGYTITILGSTSYQQGAHLVLGGAFDPTVIENALDKLTMECQQLVELSNRSVTLPVSSSASAQLPGAVANQFLAWNNTGTAIINSPGATGVATTSFGASLIQTANAAGALTVLGAQPTASPTFTGTTTVSGLTASGGAVSLTGATAATAPTPAPGDNSTNIATTAFVQTNGSGLTGFRNRVINGAMQIDQRNAGASQTFTAAGALAYCVDRFYGYCTGANVSGQRVAGSGTSQYRYQFTGAASVTSIGFGQRIETLNTYDLNGTTCTLSVDLANSLLTSVTWTAYYATSADAFGTIAAPTRTQIATGTFTVTSTVTNYSAQISVPSAATTGIEIVFTVGAQTSGTWTIGNVQLEKGSAATAFERRGFGLELALCQRYFQKSYDMQYAPGTITANGKAFTYSFSSNGVVFDIPFQVRMRATPVGKAYSPATGSSGQIRNDGAGADTAATISGIFESSIIITGVSVSAQQIISTHWTAEVEL